MDPLPETKLLIEAFGDANYALGTCDTKSPSVPSQETSRNG